MTIDTLASPIREALVARGFTTLTPVQRAVLAPELAGKDLRVSSQTGSGKTVAIALLLAPELDGDAEKTRALPCRPRAIIIAPTRELAAQVQQELSASLAKIARNVVAVTGGTSVRGELSELSKGADVIVGTPGRLLDHLERGAIDASVLKAVVLDEADQMLDLGFREALESILAKLPTTRRTVMVSATFSRDVLALARRYQRADAVSVEGTQLGRANTDIAHVIHVVPPSQRLDAVINLLLMNPEEQTLVFVRTRADTSQLAAALSSAGFAAASLSGEMEQRERTRTLDGFRTGSLKVLVATDVAARGIHVEEIGRVIHADAPSDADAYTHRSGRTGRAGKKGTSIVLVAPMMLERARQMVRRARVEPQVLPLPTADSILEAADDRLREKLASPPEAADPRVQKLAERLLAEVDPLTLVTSLLAGVKHSGPCAPRAVSSPRAPVRPPARPASMNPGYPASPAPRGPAGHVAPSYPGGRGEGLNRFAPARAAASNAPSPSTSEGYVAFRVTWGQRNGADPRRVLALVCRRGDIRGTSVGSITVGDSESVVEVGSDVAASFAASAAKPDARDKRVRIERLDGGARPSRAQPHDAPMAPKREGGNARPTRRRVNTTSSSAS
jgi:ATP-dependent RNA helicase DeaD